MTKTSLPITLLCLGLLAAAGLAAPVAAEDGEDARSAGESRRDAAKERMENRSADPAAREDRAAKREAMREDHSLDRQDRHERMRAAHDAWQECKRDANATGNRSHVEECGDEKSFFLNATKARREGIALHGAIAALERRIGRLEAREIALEQQLEDGNLTDNETAQIEAKIAKIDGHQERMSERLQAMHDRLDARHAKWHAVMDDAEAADESDGDESESEGESESESESESETSTSA